MPDAKMGFVLDDWAKPHWQRSMDHTIEHCYYNKFAVVCWDLQSTVFVASTRQECVQFLGNDPHAEEEGENIREAVEVGIGAGLTFEQILLLASAGR